MTKVELVKGEAFELKPGKKYLLIFSQGSISKRTALDVAEALGAYEVEGVQVLVDGDPKDVKIIEDNRNATT